MADWAMVVLTGIYVIATIFICRFNYGATQASKEQAAEMRRQYDEDNRPYITVELIYERRAFFGLRFSITAKGLQITCAYNSNKNLSTVLLSPHSKKLWNRPEEKSA